MADTPERIWAWPQGQYRYEGAWRATDARSLVGDMCAEYIRADVCAAELAAAKAENKWLRGNCDADPEGVHSVISEGRYKFCAKCGETITPDKLRMAKVFAELAAAKAEVARLRADLREAAMQGLADLGQAQDAYDAQLKAEAEVARLRDALVKVKPLEWFEAELPSRGGGKWRSEGYTIRKIEGLYLVDFAGDTRHDWRLPNLEAAKAAAQADYERRILAAIDTAASGGKLGGSDDAPSA